MKLTRWITVTRFLAIAINVAIWLLALRDGISRLGLVSASVLGGIFIWQMGKSRPSANQYEAILGALPRRHPEVRRKFQLYISILGVLVISNIVFLLHSPLIWVIELAGYALCQVLTLTLCIIFDILVRYTNRDHQGD